MNWIELVCYAQQNVKIKNRFIMKKKLISFLEVYCSIFIFLCAYDLFKMWFFQIFFPRYISSIIGNIFRNAVQTTNVNHAISQLIWEGDLMISLFVPKLAS